MRSKKFIYPLLVVFLFCWPSIYSQVSAQQNATIPPFKVLQSSGRFFTASDLQKKKPFMLVYFAPDCDHCQTLMKDLFKKIDAFKALQILMVTFKPVEDIRPFEQQYKTASFSNIVVGTEGTTYFLRYHYKLANTPFVALYNKEGAMVSSYRTNIPFDALLKDVKNLK